jgi:hypothetical protein
MRRKKTMERRRRKASGAALARTDEEALMSAPAQGVNDLVALIKAAVAQMVRHPPERPRNPLPQAARNAIVAYEGLKRVLKHD